LALRASFDGNHYAAILHLKALLKDEPNRARALLNSSDFRMRELGRFRNVGLDRPSHYAT